MHRMALVRGINTTEDDHGKGDYIMHTGRRQEPAEKLSAPRLGRRQAARQRATTRCPATSTSARAAAAAVNRSDAAFLGPRYASVALGDGQPPANLLRPADAHRAGRRRAQRPARPAQRPLPQTRRTAETEAYTNSYDQAAQLMSTAQRLRHRAASRASVRDRYGTHDFGRHCLLARRLLEAGVTFVKVTHSNYDTHHENFDFHIEQLGEFDRPFATLLDDLDQRGLLDTTLVIVMSEFGRTPTINRNYRPRPLVAGLVGRPGRLRHQGRRVVGKTNANGTAVVDRQVHGGHLFHTYLRALGLDPHENHYITRAGRSRWPTRKADAINEVLA